MTDAVKKFNALCAAVLQLTDAEIVDTLSPMSTPAWDSFNALTLVSELEKGFDVHFTQQEVRSVKNVADLKKILSAHGVKL